MSAITLRDATLDDIPEITGIYRDAVLNGTATFELTPPDEAEMRARMQGLIEHGFAYIVAEDAHGAVQGYAYAGPYRARPAYRWTVEDSVYVAPSAKGKGVGRELLLYLILAAEERGFRQMVAVIGGSDHAPSIRLHERAGFKHVGVLKDCGFKFGEWIDTVFMQMQIGAGGSSLPDEAVAPGSAFRR